MSQADKVYKEVIEDILSNGKWDKDAPVRTVWKDGTPAYTKSLLNVQMKFDNGEEITMLTQKRVPQKDPLSEIFWIWQKMSNVVQDLRDMGCNVWNEWERKDGTIGRSYGWQLANKKRKIKKDKLFYEMLKNGEFSFKKEKWHQKLFKHIKLNQVDYLLYILKKDPHSRRIKTTLWSVNDLDRMSLEPCVYETHFQSWDDALHLTVNVRSNDMGLGNPYNIYQYSILHRLIAQVTGHKVGTICFNVDNAHIYERHVDSLTDQISRPMHDAPEVWINPEITSFYDFTTDDIKIIGYEHEGSVPMEIAI